MGDVFSGKFVDGKRQGHGVLKQGQLTSFLASIHAGDWVDNKRCGYGVLDEITTGGWSFVYHLLTRLAVHFSVGKLAMLHN
jgi:hypothetical protein